MNTEERIDSSNDDSIMCAEWDSLPLLPLRCILDHLSVENALAAMSTCRHWRSAMLMYEGQTETLKLNAKQLEKNLFLTRLFRKHVRNLHIYIDCGDDELNKFMNFVLPQFFDAIKLQEVVFIGPIYMQQNPLVPFAKLKRLITESLVFKHSRFIEKLAFMGCEMAAGKNDNDRYVHKQVEYYSKPLSFDAVTSPADVVLSRCNVDMMMYSTLKHIVFEYELLTTESLETLSQLANFSQLTMNVTFKRQMHLTPIDWHRVNAQFTNGLDVAVNIISLPHRRFKAVVDNVFVEGMSLTSLKVMFCKTMYIPLISHICCLYNTTLRELVWADCPYEGAESARSLGRRSGEVLLSAEVYNQVNPFILLCWQCVNLRRLVIHGYWIWQYDLLGFTRLRKSLQLEVSSIYANTQRFSSRPPHCAECVLRVMEYDSPALVNTQFIQEVSSYAGAEWRPVPWRRLPGGLRARAAAAARAAYAVREALQPLGVT